MWVTAYVLPPALDLQELTDAGCGRASNACANGRRLRADKNIPAKRGIFDPGLTGRFKMTMSIFTDVWAVVFRSELNRHRA